MDLGLFADRDQPPAACDVAVIGGGIGGLVTGALLARAGIEVCVIEAGAKPGGYLAGFSRGGFAFDTAVHWLNQCGPDGMVRRIFDLIGPGGLETPPLER
ncbi:MAG TPA: FAD-dependent oxidoreductase, partial [Polyangia bacterium]|nr:FAD-dependent oxidoreductase [Polyangia bacterium]